MPQGYTESVAIYSFDENIIYYNADQYYIINLLTIIE